MATKTFSSLKTYKLDMHSGYHVSTKMLENDWVGDYLRCPILCAGAGSGGFAKATSGKELTENVFFEVRIFDYE